MSSFTPTDVSGMQLWFDANDPNCYTMTINSTIAQLIDKSGNGNNTTSIKNVSGGYPTLQIRSINYLPVFNLFNCGFVGNLSGGSQNVGTTMSFCMVVIFTNLTTQFPRILAFGNNDGVGDNNTTQKMCLTVGYLPISLTRNNVYTTTPVTMSINTPYLVTGYFDGTNEYLGVNGVYNYVATGGNFNIINYGIGVDTYNFGNSAIGKCKYGEIIVYKSALSTLNMQRMEGYLASKWGLRSSLPINHPFYYSSVAYNTPIPRNISGLQLWFDASDPNSYTLSDGSNNIVNLNDKSPNANTTNAYYGTQPTFQTNIINTLPVFNMANGAFGGNFYSPNRGNSLSFCMIVIITSYTGLDTNAPVILSLGNFGTNVGTVPLIIQDQQLQLQLNSGNVVSPVTINLNTPYLVTCYINNTSQYLGVNGIYASTSNIIANENIYSYGIGYNTNDAGEIGNFKYGEIIVFNTQLSTTSLQQLEGYLAWKWATNTSLPNTHPYYYYAPALIIGTSVTSNFVPANLPGLHLWLDALDYSTLTFDVINNVSQWNDKSGYARNATYLGNTTITGGSIKLNVGYKPFGFNNLPAITYDFSTKQGLNVLMPAGTLSLGCTLFVVFKSSSLSNSTLLCRDVAAVGQPFMIYGGYRYINSLNGNSSYNIGTTSTASTIYSCTITNTSIWNDYINGTISFSQYIASTYIDNSTRIGIGLRSDYATWFRGSMSEILVYNQALPTQSRQLIEGYLAWKWNLASSLPSTHPYKLGMPSDVPYSGITTPIPTWLQYYSTANKLLQSYMNGFLDISGNLIVRGYPTTMLGGDLITNGNVYMNGGNLITGGNINVSNIFGLSSGITTNMLTVNSDVSLSNIVTSSFTNLSNLTISGNLILMNGLTQGTYSPFSLSGLGAIADFDANLNVVSSSNKVSQWTDTVSGIIASQSNSSNQPTLIPTQINGSPAIDFSSADGNILITNNPVTTTTNITMFFIVKHTSTKFSTLLATRGSWLYGCIHINYSSGNMRIACNTTPSTSAHTITSFTATLNEPYLLTINISVNSDGSGYINYSINGNTMIIYTFSYGVGPTTLNSYFEIGGWSGETGRNFGGGIGEFTYFNKTLTTSQIQQVQGYLAWKWGLNSSLPAGHPYKNIATGAIVLKTTTIGKNISNSGAIGRGNSTVTIPNANSNISIAKGIPFLNNTTGNCNVSFNSNVFNDTTTSAMNCTKVGYNSGGGNPNGTSVGSYNTNGYTSGTTIGYGTGGGIYTTTIGANASQSNATNSTMIGYNTYVTVSNTMQFGNSAETVYIPGRFTTQTISTTITPKLTANSDAYVSGYVSTKGNVFINGTTTLYRNLIAMNSGGFIINATYDGNCVSGDPTGTGAGVFSINGMPQGIPYRSVISIQNPFYIYKVVASCKTVPTIQAGGPTIQLYNGTTIICSVAFTTGQTTATANFNTLFSTNNAYYVMFATSASPGSGGTFWKATYFCRWF